MPRPASRGRRSATCSTACGRRVSADTRARVLDVAERLGYVRTRWRRGCVRAYDDSAARAAAWPLGRRWQRRYGGGRRARARRLHALVTSATGTASRARASGPAVGLIARRRAARPGWMRCGARHARDRRAGARAGARAAFSLDQWRWGACARALAGAGTSACWRCCRESSAFAGSPQSDWWAQSARRGLRGVALIRSRGLDTVARGCARRRTRARCTRSTTSTRWRRSARSQRPVSRSGADGGDGRRQRGGAPRAPRLTTIELVPAATWRAVAQALHAAIDGAEPASIAGARGSSAAPPRDRLRSAGVLASRARCSPGTSGRPTRRRRSARRCGRHQAG